MDTNKKRVWTQEELHSILSKKRVLKESSCRRAKKTVKKTSIRRAISLDCEFMQNEIKEVLDSFFKVAKQMLLDGQNVNLKGIGTLVPVISPPRRLLTLDKENNVGGERITEPAYKARFYPTVPFKTQLSKRYITDEAIDNMYKK